MEKQTILLRCGRCRQLRPGQTPTAIGKLLRTREGRWQAYRMERSQAPLKPIRLDGTWKLGDPGFVIARDDQGTLESLWVYAIDLGRDVRIDRFSCRGCARPPFLVPRAKTGARALAQGLTEIDV